MEVFMVPLAFLLFIAFFVVSLFRTKSFSMFLYGIVWMGITACVSFFAFSEGMVLSGSMSPQALHTDSTSLIAMSIVYGTFAYSYASDADRSQGSVLAGVLFGVIVIGALGLMDILNGPVSHVEGRPVYMGIGLMSMFFIPLYTAFVMPYVVYKLLFGKSGVVAQ